MFCIFNLWSISQAGRRGFEPRLPLQESITYENHENRAYCDYCVKLSGTTEPPLIPAPGLRVTSDPDPTGCRHPSKLPIHGHADRLPPWDRHLASLHWRYQNSLPFRLRCDKPPRLNRLRRIFLLSCAPGVESRHGSDAIMLRLVLAIQWRRSNVRAFLAGSAPADRCEHREEAEHWPLVLE